MNTYAHTHTCAHARTQNKGQGPHNEVFMTKRS